MIQSLRTLFHPKTSRYEECVYQMDRKNGLIEDQVPADGIDQTPSGLRPVYVQYQSNELVAWFDDKETSHEDLEPVTSWLNAQLAGQFPQAHAIIGGHTEPGIRIDCGHNDGVKRHPGFVSTIFGLLKPMCTRYGYATLNIVRSKNDRVHIGTIVELSTLKDGGRFETEEIAPLASDERTKGFVHKAVRHYGHQGSGDCIRFSVVDPREPWLKLAIEQVCKALQFHVISTSTNEPDKDAALLPYCEYRSTSRSSEL